MGLFSKKKEEKTDINSMPPAPNLNNNINSGVDINKAPEVNQNTNLANPPVPGLNTNLNEIKNEVISPPSTNQINNIQNNQLQNTSNNFNSQSEEPNFDNLDSLFDISNIDIETETEEKSENINNNQDKKIIEKKETNVIDTSLDEYEELNFKNKKVEDDSIFITTSQFKALVDLTEEVKNRIKDANEIHLKIMDMKAEEDIEYENLRKIFQELEEKLYEVDKIIFNEK